MSSLTLARFRSEVRALDGHVLVTLHRRERFSLRIPLDGSGVEFTPLSTGKVRHQSWNYIERVLEMYSRTKSLHPGDYKDVTANASCTLAVMHHLTSLTPRDSTRNADPRGT